MRLAVGRDYADVPPLRGSYLGPATEGMSVEVVQVRGACPGLGRVQRDDRDLPRRLLLVLAELGKGRRPARRRSGRARGR